MSTIVKQNIRVGSLEYVKERGCMVVTGGGHTIAVFYHDGQVRMQWTTAALTWGFPWIAGA